MGRTLTPAEETELLRDTIRAAHETIKDLRKAIREAALLSDHLIARFETTANNQIRQLANWIQAEMNRHAASLNTDVAGARQEIVNQLAATYLEYDQDTGRIKLLFPAGAFDENVPLPHPDHPTMENPA